MKQETEEILWLGGGAAVLAILVYKYYGGSFRIGALVENTGNCPSGQVMDSQGNCVAGTMKNPTLYPWQTQGPESVGTITNCPSGVADTNGQCLTPLQICINAITNIVSQANPLVQKAQTYQSILGNTDAALYSQMNSNISTINAMLTANPNSASPCDSNKANALFSQIQGAYSQIQSDYNTIYGCRQQVQPIQSQAQALITQAASNISGMGSVASSADTSALSGMQSALSSINAMMNGNTACSASSAQSLLSQIQASASQIQNDYTTYQASLANCQNTIQPIASQASSLMSSVASGVSAMNSSSDNSLFATIQNNVASLNNMTNSSTCNSASAQSLLSQVQSATSQIQNDYVAWQQVNAIVGRTGNYSSALLRAVQLSGCCNWWTWSPAQGGWQVASINLANNTGWVNISQLGSLQLTIPQIQSIVAGNKLSFNGGGWVNATGYLASNGYGVDDVNFNQ